MVCMKEPQEENQHLKMIYLKEKLKAKIVAEALEKTSEASQTREMAKRAMKREHDLVTFMQRVEFIVANHKTDDFADVTDKVKKLNFYI